MLVGFFFLLVLFCCFVSCNTSGTYYNFFIQCYFSFFVDLQHDNFPCKKKSL